MTRILELVLSWWRPIAWILTGLVVIALCVIELDTLRRVDAGEGVPGTFTVTDRSWCGRGGCDLSGDFESLDHTQHLRDITTSGRDEVGDSFAVVLLDGDTIAFPAQEDDSLLRAALLGGIIIGVALISWPLVGALLWRRGWPPSKGRHVAR